MFFTFSDRSYYDLSFKKILWQKIDSMQSYKRKTFLCINISLIDSCQQVVTRSSCVTNCHRWTITKLLRLCRRRNAKVRVHLKVRRYPASSWFLLCQTREKPTARKVVRRKHHRGKSRGKRFQNWADALATKVPASSRGSCLHCTRKTLDIF